MSASLLPKASKPGCSSHHFLLFVGNHAFPPLTRRAIIPPTKLVGYLTTHK